jgi:predicted transcriptional regulator
MKTLLDRVRSELKALKGDALRRAAVKCGMSYDTVLRIRDGHTDPAFSKVQRLAVLFALTRR